MICIVTQKSCTERITNFMLSTNTCTVWSSSPTFRMNKYTVSQRWEKVAIFNSTAAEGFEQMRFCHCLWKAQFSPACTKMRKCHFHIHREDAGPKRWAFTFIWLIGLCECVKKLNGEIVCSMCFCIIWVIARSDAREIIKRPSSTLVKITWSNGS